MARVNIGDCLQIQCYKHNGKPHRSWDEAVVLDVQKDYIVFGNYRTTVIESGGNVWKTKEPAIMYFFKDEWFNVIVQLKKTGITYYCNIASPFIIEDDTIKYIDYDLDLRIFPNGSFKVLDRMEYKYHRKIMNYSDDLNRAITFGLDDLIEKYKNGFPAFDRKRNLQYYDLYKKIKQKKDAEE